MMIWQAMFGVFVFLGSGGVSYLWWVKVREIRLRQDIFAIRDDLFDAAVKNGWLDDPAYRAFREFLNMVLALAHDVSVPLFVFFSQQPAVEEPFPKAQDPRLQRMIEQQTHQVASRLVRFVRYETLTGRLVEVATRIARWADGATEKQISECVAPGRLPSGVLAA